MQTLIIYTPQAIHSRTIDDSATWWDIISHIRETGAHREDHYAVELNGKPYQVSERGLKSLLTIEV